MSVNNHRLSHQSDIARVYKKGHRLAGALFLLRFYPNNQDHYRLAIVVSLKVSKKATERNYLRRQIKAIIYPKLANLTSKDLIISVNPAALNQPYEVLEKEIERMLQTAKLC